LNVI